MNANKDVYYIFTHPIITSSEVFHISIRNIVFVRSLSIQFISSIWKFDDYFIIQL